MQRWGIVAGLALALSLLATSVAAKAKTYTASVPAPGYNTIQKLARHERLPGIRAHSKGVAIGDKRFVSLVSSQKRGRLELVVVEKAPTGWRLVHRFVLPPSPLLAKRAERCTDPDAGKLAAVVFAGDYDGDGKPEAYARRLDCQVVPAIGNVAVRRLYLVNLDGKPRLALQASYGFNALPTAMGAEVARARFVDVDKDGHDDLVIRFTGEYPGMGSKIKKTRSQRVYLWRAATDSYVERKKKAAPRGRRRR